MRGDILVIENQQAIIDVGRDTFLIPILIQGVATMRAEIFFKTSFVITDIYSVFT